MHCGITTVKRELILRCWHFNCYIYLVFNRQFWHVFWFHIGKNATVYSIMTFVFLPILAQIMCCQMLPLYICLYWTFRLNVWMDKPPDYNNHESNVKQKVSSPHFKMITVKSFSIYVNVNRNSALVMNITINDWAGKRLPNCLEDT